MRNYSCYYLYFHIYESFLVWSLDSELTFKHKMYFMSISHTDIDEETSTETAVDKRKGPDEHESHRMGRIISVLWSAKKVL